MIYDGAPSAQLPAIATVLAERLRANFRCLYLNSPPMVAGLRSTLAASGIDPAETIGSGALVLSSDQSHLVDGDFDIDSMIETLALSVKQALADGFAGLWASGDMLWEFGTDKNLAKLLAYEVELEGLLEREPALCGICQYHRDILPDIAVQVGLYTHQAVYLNQMLLRMNPYYRDLQTLQNENETASARTQQLLDHLRG